MNNGRVTVNLVGGLGNSMFQYALGRTLALKNNAQLGFGIDSYKTNPVADCSFWLEDFMIDIRSRVVPPRELARLRRYERKPGRRHALHNLLFANDHIYIKERGFDFDPSILTLRGRELYLHGWWQCERYFVDTRPTLLKDFTLRAELSQRNRELIESMASSESIAIQIRRKDYVTNPVTRAWHGELSKRYYDEALSIVAARLSHPNIFIFSDDVPWVREHFAFPYPTTHVDWNHDTSGAVSMTLISHAKHAVIANSSFGWWGAWLNNNPDKIVVAPERWFKTHKLPAPDIVPASWLRVPSYFVAD